MSIVKAGKLIGGICILCIIVLVACAVNVVFGIAEMEAAAQRKFDSILLAQEVRATSSGLTANARAYVSTGDNAYEEAYWNLVKIRSGEMPRPAEAEVAPGITKPLGKLLEEAGFTRQELALLEESVKISSDLVLIEDKAMNATKGLFQDAAGNYTVRKQPDAELARSLMFGREYDSTVQKIMIPSFRFDKLVTERIKAESLKVTASLGRSILALCVAVGIMGILFVAGMVLFVRLIIRPVSASADYAQAVAEGDLDAAAPRFALPEKNEIGKMIGSMQKMVVTLKERIFLAEQKSVEAEEQGRKAAAAVQEALQAKSTAEDGHKALQEAAANVDEVAGHLFRFTQELAARVDESGRSTEIQRARIASSLSAMAQMNSTVLDVARNAANAAEESDKARSKAGEGETIVRDSVDAINTVQQDTRELKEHMQSLGEQANSIGSIMAVISDIADQTNLLALNAAIEAARAGDAGRGFAVVADEVRKLAEKTMGATQEVRQAIEGIQSGTRRSIATVERTTGNLDSTAELVNRSGEALKEIVQDISVTAAQITGIATATEEQSASSEEITGSLEEINRMAEDAASSMYEASKAVNELAAQSQELQELVHKLREE